MAGRPKRRDGFGGQGFKRVTVSWWLNEKLVNAVRDLHQKARKRARRRKPSLSEVAEGLIFWGLYHGYHCTTQGEEAEPESVYDPEDKSLSIVSPRSEKIGELRDGRFVEDEPEDPDTPPRRFRHKKNQPPIRRVK